MEDFQVSKLKNQPLYSQMLLVAMKIDKIYKENRGYNIEGKAQKLSELPKVMPWERGKSTGSLAH